MAVGSGIDAFPESFDLHRSTRRRQTVSGASGAGAEFVPGLKTFDHFIDLGDLLERLLGAKVELVTPESLSPFLKAHILADALDVVRAA